MTRCQINTNIETSQSHLSTNLIILLIQTAVEFSRVYFFLLKTMFDIGM